MSLTKPAIGESCRCLQCGAVGVIAERTTERRSGGFTIWPLDGSVWCMACTVVHKPYYDVERIQRPSLMMPRSGNPL